MRSSPTIAALGSLLAATTAAASAIAEEPPPPPPPSSASAPPSPESYGKPSDTEPAADEAEGSGVHMQDGFYMNFGIGLGYFTDDFEQNFVLFRDINGKAEGGSVSFQLAIGGTPAKGFVVGGGVIVEQVADPKITVEGADISNTDDISVGTFALVGPFIDWYFTPGEGLHLMAMIGGASISVRDDTGDRKEDTNPGGGGAMVGLGYNFWVAEQWSLGILGRGVGASLFGDNLRHSVGVGSLLFVGTYH